MNEAEVHIEQRLPLLGGFRFGMLLQVAIGPVCLFVFQVANRSGLPSAESAVAAVALVDFAFITLALLGIAPLLRAPRMQKALRLVGAAVVLLYGAGAVFSAATGAEPHVSPESQRFTVAGAFVAGFALTASNPLTILFWSGVFTARLTERRRPSRDAWGFGIGAALSTLAFLSGIAIAGALTARFLPYRLVTALDAAVGLALVVFAMRIARQSQPRRPAGLPHSRR